MSTHPAITSRYAVATQLTELEDIPKELDIVGSAIFTIVPSRDDINAARDMEKIRRP